MDEKMKNMLLDFSKSSKETSKAISIKDFERKARLIIENPSSYQISGRKSSKRN